MKWLVEGGRPLSGEVTVSGCKNSVLPIICASILSTTPVTLENVPNLTDVENLMKLIEHLGVSYDWDKENNVMTINNEKMAYVDITDEVATQMRASFLVTGSLLGKYGKVMFPLPGGCSIGQRPVDLHLKAYESLGAECRIEHGFALIQGNLKAGTIFLDYPSVGATENAILAAVSIKGKTRILNSSEEPEVFDLINFLNEMGADIKKEYGRTLVIEGGKPLKGITYRIMPDRIEAGTWLLINAVTQGNIKIKGANNDHLMPLIEKLKEGGFEVNSETLETKLVTPKTVTFQTGPHPSFPTDLQPQLLCLTSVLPGMHIGVETVFENRFQHVQELNKMGANIKVFNRIAVTNGVERLSGARVSATDLRAGAALVMAGLLANGTTVIENPHYIDRGYENFIEKLQSVGANIYKEE